MNNFQNFYKYLETIPKYTIAIYSILNFFFLNCYNNDSTIKIFSIIFFISMLILFLLELFLSIIPLFLKTFIISSTLVFLIQILYLTSMVLLNPNPMICLFPSNVTNPSNETLNYYDFENYTLTTKSMDWDYFYYLFYFHFQIK
jgi:hypothetical protein